MWLAPEGNQNLKPSSRMTVGVERGNGPWALLWASCWAGASEQQVGGRRGPGVSQHVDLCLLICSHSSEDRAFSEGTMKEQMSNVSTLAR